MFTRLLILIDSGDSLGHCNDIVLTTLNELDQEKLNIPEDVYNACRGHIYDNDSVMCKWVDLTQDLEFALTDEVREFFNTHNGCNVITSIGNYGNYTLQNELIKLAEKLSVNTQCIAYIDAQCQ